MEFLKIISDDTSIEIIPLNKVFSVKVIMGKLYINGENKHLKVKKSEEFLNTYAGVIAQTLSKRFCLCIQNENGYAKMYIDNIELQ